MMNDKTDEQIQKIVDSITKEQIEKFEEAFLEYGFNQFDSCIYADIGNEELFYYMCVHKHWLSDLEHLRNKRRVDAAIAKAKKKRAKDKETA